MRRAPTEKCRHYGRDRVFGLSTSIPLQGPGGCGKHICIAQLAQVRGVWRLVRRMQRGPNRSDSRARGQPGPCTTPSDSSARVSHSSARLFCGTGRRPLGRSVQPAKRQRDGSESCRLAGAMLRSSASGIGLGTTGWNADASPARWPMTAQTMRTSEVGGVVRLSALVSGLWVVSTKSGSVDPVGCSRPTGCDGRLVVASPRTAASLRSPANTLLWRPHFGGPVGNTWVAAPPTNELRLRHVLPHGPHDPIDIAPPWLWAKLW